MKNVPQPTKLTIIQKSLEIIEYEGAGKLSFDRLMIQTGLSKGGLIYHFPSKDALLEGIVQYTKDVYLANYRRHLSGEPRPGRTLIACLKNFTDDSSPSNGIVYTALQAVLAEKPTLLALYKDIYAQIRYDILADGGDFAVQWAILASIDGVWMGEVLGTYQYSVSEREAVVVQIKENIATLTS